MQLWLAYLPAHIVIAGVLGHWILLPLVRQSGTLTLRLRFQSIDFVVLVMLLLTVLAVASNVDSLDAVQLSIVFVPLVAMSVICTVAIWLGSVSVVTKAGVVRPLSRAVVMLVIIPGTLLVITATPPVVATVVGLATSEILNHWSGPRLDPIVTHSQVGFLLLAVAAAAVGLRGLSTWAVPLPQRLVEQDGGGGGEVEAIDAAEEREPDRADIFAPPRF